MVEARNFYLEGVAKGCRMSSLGLGYLHEKEGQDELAEQRFSEAFEQGDLSVLLRLGLFRYARGDMNQAVACYLKAISKGCGRSGVCLAALYMATGRCQQAGELLSIDPERLREAELRLLYLKKTWREPGVVASILGSLHSFQAKEFYREAQAGGLPVPRCTCDAGDGKKELTAASEDVCELGKSGRATKRRKTSS